MRSRPSRPAQTVHIPVTTTSLTNKKHHIPFLSPEEELMFDHNGNLTADFL
jgi:hypothetical protein